MKLYYSDILSSRKACAVARYLNAPVEFSYLDLVKDDQQQVSTALTRLALGPRPIV